MFAVNTSFARVALGLLLPLSLLHAASAQKRAIEFDLDAANSVVQIQGTVIFDFDADGTREAVPLSPQKVGGDPGPDSTFAKWDGTLSAFVDLSNNIFQAGGGLAIVGLDSGNYCPKRDPNVDRPNNECPNEEPAQYGFRLGIPSGGSVDAATRDFRINITGLSDISGTDLDTLHWHVMVVDSATANDGVGALESFAPGTLIVNDTTSSPWHNEPDPDDPIPPSFNGTFSQDGTNATFSMPINVLGFVPLSEADGDGDGVPDDRIDLLMTGTVNASGPLGAPLEDADFNLDGKVDGLDVNIYSRHINKGDPHVHDPDAQEPFVNHTDYARWVEGDANLDGIVNDTDKGILAGNFGAGAGGGSGAAAAVPEPGSLGLALLAAVGLRLFRIGSRRRRD